MGNFDEIEVAAIAIDKTTILEIKATIAMPFWLSSVANVSRGIAKKKYACPKECCTLHQSLFFFFRLIQPVPIYFLVAAVVVIARTC